MQSPQQECRVKTQVVLYNMISLWSHVGICDTTCFDNELKRSRDETTNCRRWSFKAASICQIERSGYQDMSTPISLDFQAQQRYYNHLPLAPPFSHASTRYQSWPTVRVTCSQHCWVSILAHRPVDPTSSLHCRASCTHAPAASHKPHSSVAHSRQASDESKPRPAPHGS